MSPLFTKAAPEKPRKAVSLHFYDPQMVTDRLVPGIDNIRYDISLSSKFMEFSRNMVFQLIVKHSAARELLKSTPPPPKPSDKKEFQRQVETILLHALHYGNVEKNQQIEMLAQASIFKYIALEMQAQYGTIISQARDKLRLFQGPAQSENARGYELQEILSNFQKQKKIILRRVGQELLGLIHEVQQGPVRKTRESFFGVDSSELFAIFSTPLIFTEDGKDDFLFIENYIMLGNFQRDPDRFDLVTEGVRKFLKWADSHSPEFREYQEKMNACAETRSLMQQVSEQLEAMGVRKALFSWGNKGTEIAQQNQMEEEIRTLEARLARQTEEFQLVSVVYESRIDQLICAPKNASLLVDVLETERKMEDAKIETLELADEGLLRERLENQQDALEKLYSLFTDTGLIPFFIAAYETAGIYQDFCPPVNLQQLKVALVDPVEKKKVLHLIREYKLGNKAEQDLDSASRRVSEAGTQQIRKVLIRFLMDFMRCQRDLLHLRLAQSLMERAHLPLDPKQRELSDINHTLHKFLMPEEDQPTESKVSSHVVLKADIRDSTAITAELMSRGLNPASYFSLNFFEPVRKILPRFGAKKVFLEGDAMILAILELENDPKGANSVARICSLAREIMEGIRAVNERASQGQLPQLELGIGISFQNAAPMYLMDEESPIMISKALNESDRLSGCSKLAKHILSQKNKFFNVFIMQILSDDESPKGAEEFLLHYNVQGIELNEAAFHKLTEELALARVELHLPILGEPEPVELLCGILPLTSTSFQKIIVRVGKVPQCDPRDFRIKGYTDRKYYEVCCARPVYEYVSRKLGW
ncbi:MAG: hypothetical protein A3F68_03695 [Acidobacteria bacterium RIFCSPLOWO2_12_FULL_54_10]|nr:MAG: hypothetical protein A3F68_03695 [Acidobacteria bacterium RIFCSPLOWO2_12_FULL_54_10]